MHDIILRDSLIIVKTRLSADLGKIPCLLLEFAPIEIVPNFSLVNSFNIFMDAWWELVLSCYEFIVCFLFSVSIIQQIFLNIFNRLNDLIQSNPLIALKKIFGAF